MSYSTATYRLYRQIMFAMAQELERDFCFRCDKQIVRIGDFTVEHKLPWLDVDPALFWDLENIAFSHQKCNSGAARRTDASREAGVNKGPHHRTENAPEGMAWCGGHQDYVAVENFHSNKRNASGYSSYCKDCRQQHRF